MIKNRKIFDLLFTFVTFDYERRQSSGHWSDVVPPLLIPNRVVKRISADDSMRATVCENRSWPELCFFCGIFDMLHS